MPNNNNKTNTEKAKDHFSAQYRTKLLDPTIHSTASAECRPRQLDRSDVVLSKILDLLCCVSHLQVLSTTHLAKVYSRFLSSVWTLY
jgi:hypothetical protein